MGKKKKNTTFKRVRIWLYVIVTVLVTNFIFHIANNPIHVLSFFSDSMLKRPSETWQSYGSIFRAAEKGRVRGTLLAALAQVESQGNPLAAPDWQFSFSTDLTELYAPASTSFGVMQITKGTFDLILKTCKKGESDCPYAGLATRARVRDSVFMTSGHLNRSMEELVGAKQLKKLSESNVVKLASIIHLCGPDVARRLVRVKFNTELLPRCGSHWPSLYTRRVAELKKQFENISENQQNLAAQ